MPDAAETTITTVIKNSANWRKSARMPPGELFGGCRVERFAREGGRLLLTAKPLSSPVNSPYRLHNNFGSFLVAPVPVASFEEQDDAWGVTTKSD